MSRAPRPNVPVPPPAVEAASPAGPTGPARGARPGPGAGPAPAAAAAAAAAAEPRHSALPPEEAHRLIESCQGLVRSLAWSIHRKVPPHVELDDLVAYGQVGLAQAARDFDPTRGGQFTTYAYYRIRGAILDGLSQMSWFSRRDYHASRYERMANEVLHVDEADRAAEDAAAFGAAGRSADADSDAADNGASADDAAEGRTRADVQWLSRVTGALTMAYLATGMEGAAEASAGGALTETSEPAAQAMDAEVIGKLRELVDALPDEARQLIRSAYFEGTTLEEAGRRLGISKAWASRLHAKTLVRLAHALRLIGASD